MFQLADALPCIVHTLYNLMFDFSLCLRPLQARTHPHQNQLPESPAISPRSHFHSYDLDARIPRGINMSCLLAIIILTRCHRGPRKVSERYYLCPPLRMTVYFFAESEKGTYSKKISRFFILNKYIYIYIV